MTAFACRSRHEFIVLVLYLTDMTRTHLINASARSNSSLSRAFQESSQRSVRNEQPACGNSVAMQTAIQSSKADDTVAGEAGPGLCFFGSCDVGQSVQFRIGEARYPICRSHRHCRLLDFGGGIWDDHLDERVGS